MTERPRQGMLVPTIPLTDLFEQLRNETIETPDSASAKASLKRIWSDFALIQVVQKPSDDENWIEIEFPGLANFKEAFEAVRLAQELLESGYVPDVAPQKYGREWRARLRRIRHELKLLLLHKVYLRSWEISGHSDLLDRRVIVPMALLEHQGFQIDDDWHSGRFGSLNFYNLQLHRHDLLGSTRNDHPAVPESKLPARLTEKLLRRSLTRERPELIHRVSAEYAILHNLLNYQPSTIDLEAAGAIYAEPYRAGQKKRGRKSRLEQTREFFLQMVDEGLSGMTLTSAIDQFQRRWEEEHDTKVAPYLEFESIRNHLVELGFWDEGSWNMELIMREKGSLGL